MARTRRSARLAKRSPGDKDSNTTPCKVRKIDKNQESSSIIKGQQFTIKNILRPISPTIGVTSAMIVPMDETDSLACHEELPMPKPGCSGDGFDDYDFNEENGIVHIVTKPVLPHQHIRISNHFSPTMNSQIMSPLTGIDWADPQVTWNLLKIKEDKYPRSMDLFQRHATIEPHMRSVLFSWLAEVCEVYRLHRETYYLSLEFVDRYLLFSRDVRSNDLQLIGVTALFIASKIEEIYPPKSSEFSYVCNHAFDEEEIHKFELHMIQELQWMLNPMTPNTWIQLYLQLDAYQKEWPSLSTASVSVQSPVHCTNIPETYSGATLMDLASCALSPMVAGEGSVSEHEQSVNNSRSTCEADSECCPLEAGNDLRIESASQGEVTETRLESDSSDTDTDDEHTYEEEGSDVSAEEQRPSFVFPRYSVHDYMQVSRLMDLVILDAHSLKFNYRVLAASAVYLSTNIADISRLSGLSEAELHSCVTWMQIHLDVIKKHYPTAATPKTYEKIKEIDAHKIQCSGIDGLWKETVAKSEARFAARTNMEQLFEVCAQELKLQVPDLCSTPEKPASEIPVADFITPPPSSKKSPVPNHRQHDQSF